MRAPSSRPTRNRLLLRATLAAACWAATGVASAFACTCAPVDRAAQVPATDAIFLGEVLGRVAPAPEAAPLDLRRAEYRFRVIESLKGEVPDPAVVTTPASPAACGMPFSPGERYLVFAHEREGGLQTTLCDFDVSGKEADRIAAEVRRILAGPASTPPER